jgi:hypothetical protein
MMNSNNFSYDDKPIPENIKRIRLHVIDSFINEEKKILTENINKLLLEGCNKKKVKKISEKMLNVLNYELENKRIFQIKLRGILSLRRPEFVNFINTLNYENKIYHK